MQHEKSIVYKKAYSFALEIIKLYSTMKSDHNEYIISKQLLKSGTSIGANIMEALHGESKKDFIHKMAIAHKEANETLYRLNLLQDSILEYQIDAHIFKQINELCAILTSIIRTSKTTIN